MILLLINNKNILHTNFRFNLKLKHIIDTCREYLSMKKRSVQTYPNDLYVLSMQRFLILELDLDNFRTQSRTQLLVSAVGHNFRKVLIILREKEKERKISADFWFPIKLHYCTDWQKSAHIFYRQLRCHYRRT